MRRCLTYTLVIAGAVLVLLQRPFAVAQGTEADPIVDVEAYAVYGELLPPLWGTRSSPLLIGEAARDIRLLIFSEGMRPVALGLIVGLALSLGVNRILQSQLVGVSPYDPVSVATATFVLILVALLACQIPSRRAMDVDPAVALHSD